MLLDVQSLRVFDEDSFDAALKVVLFTADYIQSHYGTQNMSNPSRYNTTNQPVEQVSPERMLKVARQLDSAKAGLNSRVNYVENVVSALLILKQYIIFQLIRLALICSAFIVIAGMSSLLLFATQIVRFSDMCAFNVCLIAAKRRSAGAIVTLITLACGLAAIFLLLASFAYLAFSVMDTTCCEINTFLKNPYNSSIPGVTQYFSYC